MSFDCLEESHANGCLTRPWPWDTGLGKPAGMSPFPRAQATGWRQPPVPPVFWKWIKEETHPTSEAFGEGKRATGRGIYLFNFFLLIQADILNNHFNNQQLKVHKVSKEKRPLANRGMEKLLTNDHGNANKWDVASLQWQKDKRWQVLARMKTKGNPCALLTGNVRNHSITVPVENSAEAPPTTDSTTAPVAQQSHSGEQTLRKWKHPASEPWTCSYFLPYYSLWTRNGKNLRSHPSTHWRMHKGNTVHTKRTTSWSFCCFHSNFPKVKVTLWQAVKQHAKCEILSLTLISPFWERWIKTSMGFIGASWLWQATGESSWKLMYTNTNCCPCSDRTPSLRAWKNLQ